MSDLFFRLLILAMASLVTWLIVRLGRRFVEQRRQRALAAAPLVSIAPDRGTPGVPVHILAFSSEDCAPCHRLQKPALRRVLDARGAARVEVIEIDGPSSPELTKRYNVLTVPTTVVLDASGHARAVNYGFANAQTLLRQVDEALTLMQAVS